MNFQKSFNRHFLRNILQLYKKHSLFLCEFARTIWGQEVRSFWRLYFIYKQEIGFVFEIHLQIFLLLCSIGTSFPVTIFSFNILFESPLFFVMYNNFRSTSVKIIELLKVVNANFFQKIITIFWNESWGVATKKCEGDRFSRFDVFWMRTKQT